MLKLTESGDLEKAGKILGSNFAKQAEDLSKSMSHHETLKTLHGSASVTHDELKKIHGEHAELHKAAHDALDDGHPLKAHEHLKSELHKRHGEKHEELSKLHKAISEEHGRHAEHFKAQVDSLKAVAAEFGAAIPVTKAAGAAAAGAAPDSEATGVAALIQKTTEQLTVKALKTLDEDPVVQDKIREMVLKGVSEALGREPGPMPGPAAAVYPEGVRPVPRAGQQAIAGPTVDPEFEKLIKLDD